MALYEKKMYDDALSLAMDGTRKFPEQAGRIYYWMATVYMQLGQHDNAIRALESGIGQGHWWNGDMLLEDPSFNDLRDRRDFKTLVSECKSRGREAKENTKPELVILTPSTYSESIPPPLLIALHGRGRSAADSVLYWESTLASGVVLAVPQSSQPTGSDMYCWDEETRAEREIVDAYNQARSSYATNPERTILAGMSQGGEWAIYMGLKQVFPCKGFISVVPSNQQFPDLIRWIDVAAKPGVRGFLMTGEKDFAYLSTRKLHEKLVDKGLKCQFFADPELGHDFPTNFERKLSTAIDFILS